MFYIMTLAKSLPLIWGLYVGAPATCPDQIDGLDDEEPDCEVVAYSAPARIVVLARKVE